MRVLELSLRNYRIFEEVDLELPARVIGIFGVNGAGKSTLMESIAFACYGVDAARTKKQEIRTHGVLTDCEVRLVFEHAGQPYEVRRTISGKGHTPGAELFGGGMTLATGTTEVDAEIRRLLHMDLQVFRASVYAEQKQLDAFSDVTPGRRKEMALRLLGIRPVEDARNASRREARATKESADQLTGAVPDVAALEADLKAAKDVVTEARRLAKAAAAELKEAIAVEKAATKAFAGSDAVRQRIEKLTVELRAKTEQRDHAGVQHDALVERVERMTVAVAELPAIEEELSGLTGIDERLRLGTALVERTNELAQTQERLDAAPEIDRATVLAALETAAAAVELARAAAAAADAELAHRSTLLDQAIERLERAAEADPSEPCPTCGRAARRRLRRVREALQGGGRRREEGRGGRRGDGQEDARRTRTCGEGAGGRGGGGGARARRGRAPVGARRAGRGALGRGGDAGGAVRRRRTRSRRPADERRTRARARHPRRGARHRTPAPRAGRTRPGCGSAADRAPRRRAGEARGGGRGARVRRRGARAAPRRAGGGGRRARGRARRPNAR